MRGHAWAFAACVALALPGCVVPGEGWTDSDLQIEAYDRGSVIGPGVTAVAEARDETSELPQRSEPLLGHMECHAIVGEGESGRHEEIEWLHAGRRVEVMRNHKSVLQVELPRAFSDTDLEFGIDTIGARGILMLVKSGPDCFGLAFVGIYDANGTTLYEAVMAADECRRVRKTERGLLILGETTNLEVRLSP